MPLRAVAVVNVDVENGHTPAERLAKMFGGDGGVVQVAESTGGIGIGVVTRRPAQGVGDAAVQCGTCRLDGGLRRAVNRLPGAFADRRRGIGGVVADETEQTIGASVHVRAREMPGEDLVADVGQLAPAAPDVRKKGH